MSGTVVRAAVVPQRIDDHFRGSVSLRPQHRMPLSVFCMPCQELDVVSEPEMRVLLVQDGEIVDALGDSVPTGSHADLRRSERGMHGRAPHPDAAQNRLPLRDESQTGQGGVNSEQRLSGREMGDNPLTRGGVDPALCWRLVRSADGGRGADVKHQQIAAG